MKITIWSVRNCGYNNVRYPPIQHTGICVYNGGPGLPSLSQNTNESQEDISTAIVTEEVKHTQNG